MSNLLTIEQRQAFEEQGYLLVQGVLDEQVFDSLRHVIASAINDRAE